VFCAGLSVRLKRQRKAAIKIVVRFITDVI
jgi:hypothetical protein